MSSSLTRTLNKKKNMHVVKIKTKQNCISFTTKEAEVLFLLLLYMDEGKVLSASINS